MDLETKIRRLARSPYYLRLYNSSKEIGNISLFENCSNFSGIQVIFLYWLSVYSMLYKELGEQEWLNLDEKVIESDIRCDAFLYWRSKKIEADLIKYKEEMRKMHRKGSKNKNKGETLSVWDGKGKKS